MEKGCFTVVTTQTANTPDITTKPPDLTHLADMYGTYDNNTSDTNHTANADDINDSTNTTNGTYNNDATRSIVNTSEDIYNGGLKCWDTNVKEVNLRTSLFQVTFPFVSF